MLITQILEVSKSRSKVYIDYEFAFVLYKGELHKYQVKENEEISEEIYIEILKVILPKRAKLRSMNLLKSREYTEKQLRDKLKSGFYPLVAIDEAVEYVKSYHYIDDIRYTRQYIECSIDKKSRQRIQRDLQNKGIAKETIQEQFEDLEEHGTTSDEATMIHDLLIKKKYNPEQMDNKERNRIFSFLYRKGFQLENIRKAMDFSPFT